jgi:hypothetical protein
MRSNRYLLIASLLGAGCGDDALTCGPGTVVAGGACVADDSVCGAGTTFNPSTGLCETEPTVTCAPGTIDMDGECVPDGTVICGAGTMYDASSGRCIPDITGCGEGTVNVGGVCVPFDDSLVADNEEGGEPNDATMEGATVPSFEVPEVDATVSFSGCVVPTDFDADGSLDVDLDSWLFNVTEPTLLEISVAGRGGLSGGFVVIPTDPALVADGYVRAGVSLTSHRAERRLYLPKAGTYVLSFTDGRSILIGPAGGDDACYFAQVTRRAVPAPADLTAGGATGTSLRTPLFYQSSGTADQLLFASLVEEAEAADGSLVALVGGDYYRSAAVTADLFGTLPATVPIADLSAGAEVLLVVDAVLDYSLDETPWTLEVRDVGARPLPRDGTITATHSDGPSVADRIFFSLDAAEGEVVHLAIEAGGDAMAVRLFGPDGEPKTDLCADCTEVDAWYRADAAGTHYVAIRNLDGVDGEDYEIQSDLANAAPVELTIGTPATADLRPASRAFFLVDTSGASWLELRASMLTDLITADVTIYPDLTGVLDVEVPSITAGTLTATTSFGRVVEGEERTLLVSIDDAGPFAGSETLTFTAQERTFVDLGTVSAAAPIAPAAASIPAAGERAYFLVRAADGSQLTVTAAPGAGADVRIVGLERDESARATADEEGAAGAEALVHSLGGETFLAFAVERVTGGATTVMLGVTAIDPPYSVGEGTLAFTDVCSASTAIALDNDDDALSAPIAFDTFAFEYFGERVSSAVISTNGWLTFDASYDGAGSLDPARYENPASLPEDGDPDAIVAPFWTDLAAIELCVLKEAARVVVQWRGTLYGGGAAVELQVVFHADGSFDVMYGAGHEATAATIGIENADHSFGLARARGAAPSTSLSFAPR